MRNLRSQIYAFPTGKASCAIFFAAYNQLFAPQGGSSWGGSNKPGSALAFRKVPHRAENPCSNHPPRRLEIHIDAGQGKCSKRKIYAFMQSGKTLTFRIF